MKLETQRAVLASWPLAVATLVVAGLPWQVELGGVETAHVVRSASPQLMLACREQHPPRPEIARSGDASARSQSPTWLRRHAADIEHCLRQGPLAAR